MRNNKFSYYLSNYLRQSIPRFFYQRRLKKLLLSSDQDNRSYVFSRVDYYNKLYESFHLSENACLIKDFKYRNKLKTYFFDAYKYLCYFPTDKHISYVFGDVIEVPVEPSFVKSRPINDSNSNSVLLKLNEVRHFLFIKDVKRFEDKQDILIGRAKVFEPHIRRNKFLEMYFNHPLCDVGQINLDGKRNQWLVNKMSIKKHLNYKFILCLEGNDVATNLKWVMMSNSLAVMPKPKYETWFMEGTLIPDFHYVCIKDDFSDLEERLLYYINHPEKAKVIIDNAHNHVKQFMDTKQETIIALLTIKKYFAHTFQGLSDITIKG